MLGRITIKEATIGLVLKRFCKKVENFYGCWTTNVCVVKKKSDLYYTRFIPIRV